MEFTADFAILAKFWQSSIFLLRGFVKSSKSADMAKRPPTTTPPATVADCLAYLQSTARLFRGKSDAGAAIAWAQAEILIGDLLAKQTEQAATQPAADHETP